MKTPIKNFYNQIVGYIEEDSSGNKTVYDFYQRKVGSYNKKLNITRDFYGVQIGKGDLTLSLLDFK